MYSDAVKKRRGCRGCCLSWCCGLFLGFFLDRTRPDLSEEGAAPSGAIRRGALQCYVWRALPAQPSVSEENFGLQ
jgi:hypothetical protein